MATTLISGGTVVSAIGRREADVLIDAVTRDAEDETRAPPEPAKGMEPVSARLRHDRNRQGGGREKGSHHCKSSDVSSCADSGISQPVTERRRSSTSAAAALTSSALTASRTAGHS